MWSGAEKKLLKRLLDQSEALKKAGMLEISSHSGLNWSSWD
jgi:hypothetical protein